MDETIVEVSIVTCLGMGRTLLLWVTIYRYSEWCCIL